jgi:hypothetical protein
MDCGWRLEAERHFRKIAGFQALPKLVAALLAHDAASIAHARLKTGNEPLK